MGTRGEKAARPRPPDLETIHNGSTDTAFEDLELGRIAGVGQFGLVRIAQHRHTKQVFALKVRHCHVHLHAFVEFSVTKYLLMVPQQGKWSGSTTQFSFWYFS